MDSRSELRKRLRESDEAELDEIFAERLAELESSIVDQVFRNPFLAPRHVELLARIPAIASGYAFRRELVAHRRSPRSLALQHVGGLFWADLARVGTDTRIHPLIRRAADQCLLARLPGLAAGEKLAVARRCSAALVVALRKDRSPRVIGALLENPRLTESLLLPLAGDESASPQTLRELAGHRRWSQRAGLRRALCRNPATPVVQVVRLLSKLTPTELRSLADDSRLAAVVRRRARELAGGGATSPGRPASD